MKRITLFLMACCMSVMTFAAGGNITYVLNGGVTNDNGWQNKNDMYMGLYEAWNTFKGGGQTAWKSLDDLAKENDPVASGIPTQASTMDLTFIQDAAVAADWQWLIDYMDAICTEQQATTTDALTLPSTNASYLRYNLAAFFVNGKRAAWPISANYIDEGQPEAFMSAWGHAFAGQDSYDGSTEVVIPTPYKEGYSFYGWYTTEDFSGDKVTSIPAGAEGDITLYAKWGDYIPTCKEVQDMEAGATTTATGVVTYVKGTTAYIQDVKGGLMVEFTEAPEIARGDKVIIEGTTAALDEYMKLTDATLVEKETATLPATPKVLLSTLVSEVFKYVTIEGLTIIGYEGDNAIVSDGTNSVPFAAGLTLPANTKISIKAVVSYADGAFTLVGVASDVTAAPVPRPDPGVYQPITEDGKQYTLTNKWLVSNTLDNFTANPVGGGSMVRGMTAKDGKMYFVDREKRQLTVFDGATGAKLDPIPIADNVFKQPDYANPGEVKDAGTLILNDIKKDAAGNILVGNCFQNNDPIGTVTTDATQQNFQVWKINLEDGTGTIVVDECLRSNPDFTDNDIRFDAFGVYGDVDGNAIIMAANAAAMEAYKWTVTGGVAGKAEQIIIDNYTEGTFLTGLSNPGTAPQILPVDDNYFYLDGNATLPTLIDMEGNVVDGFFNDQQETWTVGNNAGHNGVTEFEMGGEYFLLMASMNTAGSPPSTFTLFKFKDANKEFKDIQSLWTLPAAGMGGASNPYRAAIPVVEVDEATQTATIYLYTGENGYGVYEFKIGALTSIKVVDSNAINVYSVANEIRLSEAAASVKVYNLAGQLVRSAQVVSSLQIANAGVYVVTVQTLKGETVTKKVIIK